MSGTSRREFLRVAGTGVGASALLAALPPSIRDALATPAARVTGTIEDVEHVVVLMQENRSFDHYFGTLRGVRGFDDPRPIPLPGGDPVWFQPQSQSGYVRPFRLDTSNSGAQCMDDIDHSWKGSHALWKDHSAWVITKGPMCMGYFARADLPYYYALADAFTVCDAYYCSIQGPTNPNRMHLFAATSGLAVGRTGSHCVHNVDDGNWTADITRDNTSFPAFTWTTYAERLQGAGVSWRVYQEYDNYGDNSLAYFAPFRGIGPTSPLYQRARRYVPGSNAGNAYTSLGEHLVAEFARDVRLDTLPQVSWIVTPYILSEHPEASPAYGESLVARLLEALAANPAVWSKTVFIINYDENGGFFDHVPPHLPPINRNLGLSTTETASEDYHGVPVGLGIRVPMLVVSPWTKGGWVNSQVFDHTSVIRFLEARFGVYEPGIGAWRRAVTGDLTSVFDFATPDAAWPALPDTSAYIANADASCNLAAPVAPGTPSVAAQEPGLRRARALPYRLHVHGRIDKTSGRYWLDFANEGTAGTGFNVYSLNRTDGPWFYTVEAGRTLSDYWSARAVTQGIYDLSVYGPNGFLRQFQGNLNAAVASGGADADVIARYDVPNNRMILRLRNRGSGSCRLTVRANHYTSAAPRSYTLAPGKELDVSWPLNASAHWYDISVTSDRDAGFLRRLAGHMETGRASVSDPLLGGPTDRLFADGYDDAVEPEITVA